MKIFPIFSIGSAVLSMVLTGCASITTGQNQTISVQTYPEGAKATLRNDKGTWYVPKTPGSVTVLRAYGDLQVTCEKEGYTPKTLSVKSCTKGMAFDNLLAGGIIGAAVDVGTGSAYDYPSLIEVNLDKTCP